MVGEKGEYSDGATEPKACSEKDLGVPGRRLVGTGLDQYYVVGFECAASGKS